MSNLFSFDALSTRYVYTSLEAITGQRCIVSITGNSSYQQTVQSSSITSNGHLWERELAKISGTNLATKKVFVSDQSSQKRDATIQLLNSWREDDEQEQKETLEYLRRVLDEDRLSERKHFP